MGGGGFADMGFIRGPVLRFVMVLGSTPLRVKEELGRGVRLDGQSPIKWLELMHRAHERETVTPVTPVTVGSCNVDFHAALQSASTWFCEPQWSQGTSVVDPFKGDEHWASLWPLSRHRAHLCHVGQEVLVCLFHVPQCTH